LEASRSSLRTRFQIGVAFNFLGAIFNQGSTFGFNLVAANILGRETFGKYGMVANTLIALSQVAQFACGHTATKFVAEYRSSDKQKAGRVIGMLLGTVSLAAGLVAFVLLVSSTWLANSVLKAPELRVGLEIGSGVVFLNVLIGFFMGALAGLEAYRRLSRSLIVFGLFYLVVCSLATWRWGLNGAFTGLLAVSLFGCILLFSTLKSECRNQGIQICYGIFPDVSGMLTSFALPAGVGGLTLLPALWFGSTILVRQAEGYSQMALFSAAYLLMTAVLFIPNVTYVVGWSLLNHHKGQGEADHYRTMFKMNLVIAGAAVLLGASVLAVIGPTMLRLFGRGFTDGYAVLLIMLAAAVPQALSLAIFQHLQSQERMWLSFLAVVLPRDILLVALAYSLVPHHGAAGLAWAYAGAWTVALLIVTQITYGIGFRTTERISLEDETGAIRAFAAAPRSNEVEGAARENRPSSDKMETQIHRSPGRDLSEASSRLFRKPVLEFTGPPTATVLIRSIVHCGAILSSTLRHRGFGRFLDALSRLRYLGDVHCTATLASDSLFGFNATDAYWGFYMYTGILYERSLHHVFAAISEVKYQLLDCGANYGYWSVILSGLTYGKRNVIAIEASPRTFKVLESNWALNDKRFTCLNRAVSMRSGESLPFEGRTHDSAHISTDLCGAGSQYSGKVESISLDDICAMLQPKPDRLVIKLDIEGHEPETLMTAECIRDRDVLIIFEDHGLDPSSRNTACVLGLGGFALFWIGDDGTSFRIENMSQLKRIKKPRNYGYNFFAVTVDGEFHRCLRQKLRAAPSVD
jgi:FkbM family methyltransferase